MKYRQCRSSRSSNGPTFVAGKQPRQASLKLAVLLKMKKETEAGS
jgi:hypothetical protein